MDAPGPHSVPRSPLARFLALSLLAVPFASVIVWFGLLYLIDDGSGSLGTGIAIASLAAAVAVPIGLGIRWSLKAWWIVLGAAGGLVMWAVAFAIVWRIAIELDGSDGGSFVGGVVLAR